MSTEKPGLVPLSEETRRAWKAFFLVSNLSMARIEAVLRENGVGPLSQYDALYTLLKGPEDGLTIRELSASLTITHSGLSRMLDRLEGVGAIERSTDVRDKRAVKIRLLPRGREIHDATWEVYATAVQECLGEVLSPEELCAFRSACLKLAGPLIQRKEQDTGIPFLHRAEG